MLKHRLARRALIVAPLRVAHSTWPREIKKWDQFRHLRAGVVQGKDKAKILRDVENFDVQITTPETLEWLLSQFKGKRLPWDVLFVDESSRFKSPKSERWKLLKRHSKKFTRRYILTGSPAPDSLLDLYTQIFLLDFGASLGQRYTHYRDRYFNSCGYMGYDWQVKHGAEDSIHRAIAPLVLTMRAEDYLELPPLVINDVFVDLPDDARELYDRMERDLFAMLGDNIELLAESNASAHNKCHQIANGAIFEDIPELDRLAGRKPRNRKWHVVHNAKVEAFESIAYEMGGRPLLTAYHYTHEVERLQAFIKKEFKRDAPYIGGGVNVKTSDRLCDEWNRAVHPFLLAHPASVSHGLNMQETNGGACFYSLTYNYDHYDQFIRRLWRQGARHGVSVHRIIARDTLDEAIASALVVKHGTQRGVFDAVKKYRREKYRRLF